MIRALWFIVKLAVVVAAAIWLAERPGTVALDWEGWNVAMPFGVFVLVALAALAAAALGYRYLRALGHLPGRMRRASGRRKRERGYKALTQGMVAVAAGDAAAATRFARQADVLLKDPPLTMLLSAQAAQLNGDEDAARRYFKAMLERPETAFLGTRGLLTQALRHGEQHDALELARRANQLQPRTPWVLLTLTDLEARAGDWAAAEQTLQQAINAGAVPAAEGRHRRAALLVERSIEAEARGRSEAAVTHAQTAVDLEPGFAPAVARLSRLQVKAGRPKRGAKAIEKAWRLAPHPLLADAYTEMLTAYDPQVRYRMMQKLVSSHPGVEAELVLARAAMDTGEWTDARAHLNRALTEEPSARVLRLMAELEEAEHANPDGARDWLAKAAGAPPSPAWTCRECGDVKMEWRALCRNCGGVDSLEWKVPTAAVHPPALVEETLTTLPPGALPPSRAPVMVEATK
ncbi:MAG TPA: heme biosynthesis HemY N-terminal domain-containing protein [Azospirillaceae bacterium]|nr:heme biosynthesis HemY N-terminal domain-containing protein [Azospirillaceae bacterium]